MFWFKVDAIAFLYISAQFKYIICFGSSLKHIYINFVVSYLNTSYVLVQAQPEQFYIDALRFKYIICFGSRKEALINYKRSYHLNTSYVLVQAIWDTRFKATT